MYILKKRPAKAAPGENIELPRHEKYANIFT